MKKQYRGAVMASIHEMAEGLHNAGVMDKQSMRKFDDACLTPARRFPPMKSGRCASGRGPARLCLPAI